MAEHKKNKKHVLLPEEDGKEEEVGGLVLPKKKPKGESTAPSGSLLGLDVLAKKKRQEKMQQQQRQRALLSWADADHSNAQLLNADNAEDDPVLAGIKSKQQQQQKQSASSVSSSASASGPSASFASSSSSSSSSRKARANRTPTAVIDDEDDAADKQKSSRRADEQPEWHERDRSRREEREGRREGERSRTRHHDDDRHDDRHRSRGGRSDDSSSSGSGRSRSRSRSRSRWDSPHSRPRSPSRRSASSPERVQRDEKGFVKPPRFVPKGGGSRSAHRRSRTAVIDQTDDRVTTPVREEVYGRHSDRRRAGSGGLFSSQGGGGGGGGGGVARAHNADSRHRRTRGFGNEHEADDSHVRISRGRRPGSSRSHQASSRPDQQGGKPEYVALSLLSTQALNVSGVVLSFALYFVLVCLWIGCKEEMLANLILCGLWCIPCCVCAFLRACV